MTWNLTDPTRTLDRVLVVEGLAIWNYDYRLDRVVSFSHESHGQRWWNCEHGLFDASRMWVRHPDTGQPAADVNENKAHACGMCDGPLAYDGIDGGYHGWTCKRCGYGHTSKDCCQGTSR